MPTINIFQVLKNRSKIDSNNQYLYLYPKCIDSILENITGSNFIYKLYIYDFNSNDYPLKDWLPEKINNKLEYTIINSNSDFFDKGEGLNYSRTLFNNDDFIFYLDADNLVTKQLIERLEFRFTAINSVGFFAPIFYNKNCTAGTRLLESVGNFWIRHRNLMDMPPWINMRCWGGEDTIFLYNCLKNQKLNVIRETDVNLYHQWHPINLRNKYYRGGVPPSDNYAQAIREYYKTGYLPHIEDILE